MIWQGFPTLVVGTTDLDRQFHSFGMAIRSNEKTQNFIFVFCALQEGIQKLSLEEMNPDVLISDGTEAIRNAFQHVFGEKLMVILGSYATKNTEKDSINGREVITR